MSNIVIKVENISKQYRLGQVGTKSLGDDLKRFGAKLMGKEDPFLKIGEENDRTQTASSDYVWALRDINFEVAQGDVLGIIGKNGAGKSTLLKILSQVTRPTTGLYKIKGRIASLLEVGTGFHPDLTGRENVFLNGAILGMSKREVQSKFDEIIDFSGVERYIDTPVKRYSSGMYVRLAFAVAAHLEPEILIVDEVLAVGDADFQKKCIGKMKDVSGQGRTILFVSHNIGAISKLCSRCILIEKGKLISDGTTNAIIKAYTNGGNVGDLFGETIYPDLTQKNIQIKYCKLLNKSGGVINDPIDSSEELNLNIKFIVRKYLPSTHITFDIKNSEGETVLFSDRTDYTNEFASIEAGEYLTVLKIHNPLLNVGTYFISVNCIDNNDATNNHWAENTIKFEVTDVSRFRSGARPGQILHFFDWKLIPVKSGL